MQQLSFILYWGSKPFCSQWAELKMPHIPHHSHSEYTPVNTSPWPHTQKCGYFLISCTSHHAHPKHTWNKNTSTFSATPPTTEWKWRVKHRVEKMHGVIGFRWLQKTCKSKRREKRTCSPQRSLQPLKCLSSVKCKGCQESTLIGNPERRKPTTHSSISEVKNLEISLYTVQLKVKIRVWKSRTLLIRTGLCCDENRRWSWCTFSLWSADGGSSVVEQSVGGEWGQMSEETAGCRGTWQNCVGGPTLK